jgi:peptidoglycan/xylan/chitin deacetylase (PgdA/CDA1 family)
MLKIKDNTIYSVMYHYVRETQKSEYPNLKVLNLNDFKKQIENFSKKFNLLKYEDFLEILSTKKIPKKPSILLTFDDGYIDHFKYVLPILVKYKVSGIFYPPILSMENKKVLDTNKIHFILAKELDKNKILKFIEKNTIKYLNKSLYQLKLKNINSNNRWDDGNTRLIKALLQFHLPENIRNKIINKLFKKIINLSEKDFSKELYMNKKHINEMVHNNMHFGIHGYTHPRLGLLSYKKQEIEIFKSINSFKKIGLSTNDISICYPYGSYNKDTLDIIKKHDVKFGFTLKVDSIDNININNRFELPRLDCKDFL